MPHSIEQVVILVSGKCKYAGELSRQVPKPVMQFEEELTLLDILLDNFARQGFKSILLLAGPFNEIIKENYDGKRISQSTISVFIDSETNGTVESLLKINKFLHPYFILSIGDKFFDINYRSFVCDALLEDNDVSIALSNAPNNSSILLVNNKIIEFSEKNAPNNGLISAGVYFFKKKVIENIIHLPCSLETDVFSELARRGRLGGYVYNGNFIDAALPAHSHTLSANLPTILNRPAVFFDRDGVLNHDRGYVYQIAEFEWIPGAKEAILSLNNQGYRVFVVTNQAGVAKGYYDENAVSILHDFMQSELSKIGAYIDRFYYCPYHPEGIITGYALHHTDRKPEPGMILRAFNEWKILRDETFLIGDRETDLEAARKANIKGYLFSGGDLNKFIQIKIPRISAAVSRI